MAFKLFKIIDGSNYDSDYPDEKFLTKMDSNGTSEHMLFTEKDANTLCIALNSIYCPSGKEKRYYRVVKSNYSLLGGFEP